MKGDLIQHQPVLLRESIEALAIKSEGLYVDGTFGRGGHSREILKHLGPKGRLLAIDKDPEAVEFAHRYLGEDQRFTIIHGSFRELDTFVQTVFGRNVDGILLDLGVSSPQFDQSERGFSFTHDGPLDMRMDTTCGMTAAQWLRTVKESELSEVLKEYGEERFAKRIARAIVKARQEKAITRTKQLADIVAAANPAWERHKHPATRTFQALRIYINNELDDLNHVLEHCLNVLAPQGRLTVISFHSLEDRRVKRFLRQQSQGNLPAGLPVKEDQLSSRLTIIGRAIKPSAEEVAKNPRARSAILRVGEKK